jgi:hypothetical protein
MFLLKFEKTSVSTGKNNKIICVMIADISPLKILLTRK